MSAGTTKVTLEFHGQDAATIFLKWIKDTEGEQILEQFAEDYLGIHVNIVVQSSINNVIIGYAGRIVDDDDPEMNGEDDEE